ncbi:MAG: EamA family transporter, partial [Candidatus Acidiferrales bacterium]
MSKRTQAALAMMATTAMWGATFVLVKQALESASVFAFMVLRFGLAALVMGAMYRAAVRGMSRSELRAGVEIGLFLFAGYAFQNAGLLFTTASKSAFITGSAVVLVPLLLFAFWRRKARASAWFGAFAAFAGLFFITVPGGAGLSGFAQLNRGDILTMVGAISFALHIIFIGRYTNAHVAGDIAPRMSIGALSFVQVAVTALLSAVAIPLFHFGG